MMVYNDGIRVNNECMRGNNDGIRVNNEWIRMYNEGMRELF